MKLWMVWIATLATVMHFTTGHAALLCHCHATAARVASHAHHAEHCHHGDHDDHTCHDASMPAAPRSMEPGAHWNVPHSEHLVGPCACAVTLTSRVHLHDDAPRLVTDVYLMFEATDVSRSWGDSCDDWERAHHLGRQRCALFERFLI